MLPRLFGGGQASLELTGEDLLTDGVAILARWANVILTSIYSLEEKKRCLHKISQRDLGRGETAVLSFALYRPSAYAMLDDLAARRCAKELGIATLGTGGMLVIAKQQGIISSVGESLLALRAAGLWLSNE